MNMHKRDLVVFVVLFLLFGVHTFSFARNNLKLSSPDGRLMVDVSVSGPDVVYTVSFNKSVLMKDCKAGLDIGSAVSPVSFLSSRKRKVDEMINSPFYRYSTFENRCNELNIRTNGRWNIIFRAYNSGVAYRFYIHGKDKITINDETADFHFAKDSTSYLAYTTNEKNPVAMAFQNIYTVKKLSQQRQQLAFLPVTVDCGTAKVTLMESDLESYPGMFVEPEGTTLKGVFAHYPRKMDFYPWRKQEYVAEREKYIALTDGNRTYPWRVIAVTDRDTSMPENNLVYALASPNRIGDTSWISAGKVSWDWWNDWNLKGVPFKAGINMDTYKYYIDFASRNGLQYIILDEGWYDSKSGDMFHSIPEINVPELVAYGKKKGVGIVLWTVFNVLDKNLETLCKKYSDMGIKGFKVDFLDRDDQTAVEMAYRIASAAAKYHLILDYHGFYKPTGLNRTYPNVLNIESVFGMEEMKWNEDRKDMPMYDVTFPYIRMMCGPVDYTPGAMRNASREDYRPVYNLPMSMGTRCHQLAAYLVFDSPFTMLADAPTSYEGNEDCVDFISSFPDEVDDTKVLSGEMGKYIVTARKKDVNWFVGGMTNWDERDVTVDLSFLDKGVTYNAVLFKDGINADKNAEDYEKDTLLVNSQKKLKIHLSSGGGFALRLYKSFASADRPSFPPANKHVDPFYKKYLDVDGLYVVSSAAVSDSALMKTAEVIRMMLAKRPDVKNKMVKKGCYTMILGRNEDVCDLPEYKKICNSPDSIKYWNWRARGFGGAPQGDFTASFGEENVLALPSDRYRGESIMIHEFSHLIHTIGICGVDPTFDDRLVKCMQHAKEKGLWKDTYALSDKYEYFAECTQSFFDCNQYSKIPNGVHNSINRRVKLKEYDPEMYNLLKEYYYEIPIPVYNKVHP
jgi:alpha-glucosidase